MHCRSMQGIKHSDVMKCLARKKAFYFSLVDKSNSRVFAYVFTVDVQESLQ